MQILEPSAELMSVSPQPEMLIESAGRTCYKSEAKIDIGTAPKFVKKIVSRGHLSVIEHAYATFRIVTDRGVTHELVRHRLASFSQESTRYCAYDDGIKVIEPPGLDAVTYNLWHDSVRVAETAYMRLLEHDVSPQIARSVLPNCLATEIVVTANFREWLHILKLRTSKAAHPQIRQVMQVVAEKLYTISPTVFKETNYA